MNSVFRKIYNHWSILRNGSSAERFNMIFDIFNRTMKFLRLQNWFSISGKSCFFSIASFAERNKNAEVPQDEFPFQVTGETDFSIIPQLIECMEGSRDYNYLTTDEIIKKFEKLIQHGSIVWVARENEQMIGFFWATAQCYFAPCGLSKIAMELKNDMTFIEFAFVKADYRRKSVYSGMFKHVARLHPATRFSCIVDSFNTPSIKAQLRLGFKPSGSLLYFRFFRFFLASMRFETTRKRLFQPKEDVPYPIKVK